MDHHPRLSRVKRSGLAVVGIGLLIAAMAVIIRWCFVPIFEDDLMNVMVPLGVVFASASGAVLVGIAIHGRKIDPFPGRPDAPGNRTRLYEAMGAFIGFLLTAVLTVVLWMMHRLPAHGWTIWGPWLVAVVSLLPAYFTMRRWWRLCREDDRQAAVARNSREESKTGS
jgi:CDP-diglyceride synthetase